MRRWPAIAAALGLAHAATAFVLFKNEDDQPLRWRLDDLDPLVHPNVVNRDTRAIRYYLARDAWSAKNAAAELDAIRAAIGQWQSVPGTILKFEEGGLVPPGVDINGEVHCWGWNYIGQSTPPEGSFISVSVGNQHTCGLKTDGKAACWGWDVYGQVTDAPSGTFAAISGGLYHTCAIDTSGAIQCWGGDSYGQVTGAPTGTDFTHVSGGGYSSCAIDASGAITCWGWDEDGQVTATPAGAFVAFDGMGRGNGFEHQEHLRLIKQMVDGGLIEHVLLGHDVCLRSHFVAYGGKGYGYIASTLKEDLQGIGMRPPTKRGELNSLTADATSPGSARRASSKV